MVITPQSIDAIFYNLNTVYQGGYSAADTWYEKVATKVPSSGRENRYAWWKLIPRFREWIGERKFNNLTMRGYSLINKKYELSLAVQRIDIEDNQLADAGMAAKSIGEQAKRLPDDLVASALQSGATSLAFDGQSFFNTSHPVDSDVSSLGTYANRFTSKALTPANYQDVRQKMGAFKGEDNRPMRVRPNLLIVDPSNEMTARQILQADYIAPVGAFGINAAGGWQKNLLTGTAELLVVPELGNEAGTWYLADTTKGIKPLIYQERKAPVLAQMVDNSSPNVFLRDEYLWGADARGAVGYTLPFLMSRCEP